MKCCSPLRSASLGAWGRRSVRRTSVAPMINWNNYQQSKASSARWKSSVVREESVRTQKKPPLAPFINILSRVVSGFPGDHSQEHAAPKVPAAPKAPAAPAASKAPAANLSPTQPLSEQLRSVMRLLTHPVVICTAHDGTLPRGMTMSSFTSITLRPTPLISFNITSPSRTLDAITNSGEFNIHVLTGDQSGAAVAEKFTKGNTDQSVFDSLDNASTTGGSEGGSTPPLLKDDGVLCVLRCRLVSDAPAGGVIHVRDHVLILGEVLEAIPGTKRNEFGLSYSNRSFRKVGGVLARHG